MQSLLRNSSPVAGTGFGGGWQDEEKQGGCQSRRHDRRLSHARIIENA
jgi:hypothetical protein